MSATSLLSSRFKNLKIHLKSKVHTVDMSSEVFECIKINKNLNERFQTITWIISKLFLKY